MRSLSATQKITAQDLCQAMQSSFGDKPKLHSFLCNMKIAWAWRIFNQDFLQRLENPSNHQVPSQETVLQIANDPRKTNSLLLCHGSEWKETYGWSGVEHYALFVIHVVGLERLEGGIWEGTKSEDVEELYVVAYNILVGSHCCFKHV